MQRINFILIGTAVLLGIGISYSLANTTSSTQSSQSFQFELAAEKKALLIKGLSLIKVGDSIERVKEVLGSPTADEELIGKKGEFVSRVLDYYIKRVEANNVNIHDQMISFYFDRDGRLVKIKKSFEE
jgi:hypothetical protein